jgi:D-alanyl-lipoteichoic acid acyltransferase DltB (MBOAT superfamily)
MTFNSFPFAVFFAVVFSLYWLVRRKTPQNVLLLIASYVFYAWWDPRFLLLLIGTTVIDFFAVGRIEAAGDNENQRRGWMVFSVAVNLTVLAFFKYFGFFVDSAATMLRHLGLDAADPALRFILPVGISFYVFHEISYAVDVYRRRTTAEHNIITYGVYIAFFPQLVAGPITRAAHMLPQFRNARSFPDNEQFYSAVVLIISGLFKKVVLADGVAPIANSMFSQPQGRGALPLAMGVVAFSIQIYGDFAGYTDIARGVARLLGIDIPRNFEQPYLSRNITQFWRTWHISLSSFLHDYLYVPLGGNREGSFVTYRNLFITMLLGGLWHGASWTFVIWGGLHGIALAVHRAWSGNEARERPRSPTAADIGPIFGTFCLVSFLWIFFRAATLSDAWQYIRGFGDGLIGPNAGPWKHQLATVVMLGLVMLAIDLVDRARDRLQPLVRSPAFLQGAFAGAAVVAIIVWSGQAPVRFIYFQF